MEDRLAEEIGREDARLEMAWYPLGFWRGTLAERLGEGSGRESQKSLGSRTGNTGLWVGMGTGGNVVLTRAPGSFSQKEEGEQGASLLGHIGQEPSRPESRAWGTQGFALCILIIRLFKKKKNLSPKAKKGWGCRLNRKKMSGLGWDFSRTAVFLLSSFEC